MTARKNPAPPKDDGPENDQAPPEDKAGAAERDRKFAEMKAKHDQAWRKGLREIWIPVTGSGQRIGKGEYDNPRDAAAALTAAGTGGYVAPGLVPETDDDGDEKE